MKTYSTFSGSGRVLNISIKCSSAVLPATLTSGLGLLKVCGRMRVPQPAMGMNILRVSVNVSSVFHELRLYFTNEKTLGRRRNKIQRTQGEEIPLCPWCTHLHS